MAWTRTFLTNTAIFGFGLVGGVVIARSLGPEGRGALEALTYWPHFFAGVAALGLNEAIAIRVAREGVTSQLVSTAVALSLMLSGLLGLILLLLMPHLLGAQRAELVPLALAYLAVFLPATFVSQNLLAIVQGTLDFRTFNTQRLLQSVLYPAVLVVLVLRGALTVPTAAAAMLAGTVFVAALRLLDVRGEVLRRPSLQQGRSIIDSGIRLHIAAMAMFLSSQLDNILLLHFGTNHELGLYVAALVFGRTGMGMLVQTYITVALPTVAKMDSLHEHRSTILRHMAALSGITVVTSVAGLFLMPYAVRLLFGAAYMEAVPYARLLLMAFAFAGLRKGMTYVLRSRLSNQPAVIAESVTALVIAAVGYGALRSHGVYGLSIAVLLANVVGTAFMAASFTRELNGWRMQERR
jgi:O-antigen/teichoic acid export membrane protein